MNASKRPQDILEQMGRITRMRRGHLTEQYNRKTAPDGTQRQWGPYYTLQAWVDGKNRSARIPAAAAPAARQDVENYATFMELCERYIAGAEGLAKAEATEIKKKPRRSKPPSAGKSRNS
jgi:hypothetical protein